MDQIFLSYKLTAHQNQNRTIVIGFLLEDLDRSIFKYRDYEKVLFKRDKNKFALTNIPVNLEEKKSFFLDFYLFRFFLNFYNLIKNDFDPRLDNCHITKKKDLLNYYIEEILKISKIYNQKIVFITFNWKEDLIKKPTWRYKETRDLFLKHNIANIDSYKILKEKSLNNREEIIKYFGSDKHNNKLSFRFIVDKLFEFLKYSDIK